MKYQRAHDTAKGPEDARLFSFEFCESDSVRQLILRFFFHVKTQIFVGSRKAPEERPAPEADRQSFLSIFCTRNSAGICTPAGCRVCAQTESLCLF